MHSYSFREMGRHYYKVGCSSWVGRVFFHLFVKALSLEDVMSKPLWEGMGLRGSMKSKWLEARQTPNATKNKKLWCFFIDKESLMLDDYHYHACQSTLVSLCVSLLYLHLIKFISMKYLWCSHLLHLPLDWGLYNYLICYSDQLFPTIQKHLLTFKSLGLIKRTIAEDMGHRCLNFLRIERVS